MVNITNQEFNEVITCAKSPLYFGENYFKHNDSNGVAAHILYPKQEKILNAISSTKILIGLTARQFGISSIVNMYSLWNAIFNPDSNICIITTNTESKNIILKRIKFAYDNLPFWMKTSISFYDDSSIIFDNNSQIKIIVYTAYSQIPKELTFDTVFLSDCAWYDDRILKDIMNTISPHSNIFAWSAPGISKFFKIMVSRGNSKNRKYKDYTTIHSAWYDIPTRDEQWKDDTIKAMGRKAFDREMNCKI